MRRGVFVAQGPGVDPHTVYMNPDTQTRNPCIRTPVTGGPAFTLRQQAAPPPTPPPPTFKHTHPIPPLSSTHTHTHTHTHAFSLSHAHTHTQLPLHAWRQAAPHHLSLSLSHTRTCTAAGGPAFTLGGKLAPPRTTAQETPAPGDYGAPQDAGQRGLAWSLGGKRREPDLGMHVQVGARGRRCCRIMRPGAT